MICAALSLSDFLHGVYVPVKMDLQPNHVDQISISIRLFERWAGQTVLLKDLSEDLLRRFLSQYRLEHSPATVNAKRAQLLALWQCAYDEELIGLPPRRKKVPRAKEPEPIPEAWTAEEVGKILAAASRTVGQIEGIPTPAWWKSLLLVFYDTGERRNAVFSVDSNEIDLNHCSILFSHRKGGRRRRASLHVETVAACRAIHDPERSRMWPWPFSREALDKRFRAILKAAGVSYGRKAGGLFHKMRRTSGTLVETAGGNGANHIGATRKVFERHYLDRRFFHDDLPLLARPSST